MHTHDLDILVALLPDEHQPPDACKLGALTQYSLVRRYEEGYEILTPEDLSDTVDLARTVVTWAKNKIIPEKQKPK